MHATHDSCRFCGAALKHSFVDLGQSPPCEAFRTAEQINAMEPFYPLHAWVCDECFLVQLGEFVSPEEIFTEYAYFSSYSDSWLAHAKNYVNDAIDKLGLKQDSLVVELASNDGYLLQYFVEREVPVLGIEPARNVAEVAVKRGVRTLNRFFGKELGEELAAQGQQADLIAANNVYAHVPDIRSFTAGMKALLKPGGTITIEFPHLMRLMERNQFDTIYHEHFSYLSFVTASRILARFGLTVFDVEELPTHGGSLRLWIRHTEDTARPVTGRARELAAREEAAGFLKLETYRAFGEQVKAIKRDVLEFLIQAKREGKTVAGYGAPGKANTLLNYCGIRTDFIDYTVDRNPYKHGRFLPGTQIPIYPPEQLARTRPDYVVLMPWNLKEELCEQLTYVKDWGGKLVVFIPQVEVLG